MDKFSHLLIQCNHKILAVSLALSLTGITGLVSIGHSNGTFLSREVLIQSAALLLGMAAAAIILMLGYRCFMGLEAYLYIFSIVLLLSVYIPGLGTSFYGSRSWIDLGITTFQPSEPVKITFILLMASYLARNRESLSSPKGIFFTALYACPFILIVAKEDFGSGCVFCVIWIFMVFCSGLNLKIIGRVALVFCLLIPLFYFFLAGYQKERIDAFLNPENLDLPGNYQVWNSKVAIGSGGFWGKGLFQGTQKSLGFLPVPESDFIFSSIVEELGFIGGIVIILLFALFLYSSLKVTKYAKDLWGTLIGAGLVGMFFFQAFENIAMTMGLMPVTGITLPFMSYGGSSMLASMMGVGLLLSISTRQKV
ncbi:MAG: FtsW/RodA/SpoVE family cell cycle protein [Bacillota bacterium]|nr:FtsW/RodA/SpoVE family cell cycle protein [Bacillota bacterium]